MNRREAIEVAGATHDADAHPKQEENVYICILDFSEGSISAIKTSRQGDFSDYEDVMMKHGFKPSLCEWTIIEEKPVINFIEDKDE